MSKRCELQKEYYENYGNYKGNGKYNDAYVSWLEEQILALRIHYVSNQRLEKLEDAMSEITDEDLDATIEKMKAACASGAVDKTVSVVIDKTLPKVHFDD